MAGHTTVGDNGTFYLQLRGLPANFHWKDLKDAARKIAPHVGWVEMSVYRGARPSTVGEIKLRRRTEAQRLYSFLISHGLAGIRPTVFCWDITPPSSLPTLIGTNSRVPVDLQTRDGVARLAARPEWETFQSGSPVSRSLSNQLPSALVPHTASLAMDNLNVQFQHATLAPNSSYHLRAAAYSTANPGHVQDHTIPSHSTPYRTYGRPAASLLGPAEYGLQIARTPREPHQHHSTNSGNVNTSQGWVPTEKRRIIVTSLDYDISDYNIQLLLQSAGDLEGWQFVNPGQRGCLLAVYRTTEGALHASAALDGKAFGKAKRKITVKLANDAETVDPRGMGSSRAKTDHELRSKKNSDREHGDQTHRKSTSTRQSGPVIANGSR